MGEEHKMVTPYNASAQPDERMDIGERIPPLREGGLVQFTEAELIGEGNDKQDDNPSDAPRSYMRGSGIPHGLLRGYSSNKTN
tara:strand:+ start:155 stop:403 length:249 start_codon:yes stop_codon:yes gene_type:complete